jgi:hypothetical protein
MAGASDAGAASKAEGAWTAEAGAAQGEIWQAAARGAGAASVVGANAWMEGASSRPPASEFWKAAGGWEVAALQWAAEDPLNI